MFNGMNLHKYQHVLGSYGQFAAIFDRDLLIIAMTNDETFDATSKQIYYAIILCDG